MYLKIGFVFPPYLYNIWREQGLKGFKQILLNGVIKTFTGVKISQSMVNKEKDRSASELVMGRVLHI